MAAAIAPGCNPVRLVRLMQDSVERCGLDLTGSTVFTEAATGAYIVTPVLAAMAGAEQVLACTRTTRYGTADDVAERTYALAAIADVRKRIRIVADKSEESLSRADIVTNSGHVRPIDRPTIGRMKRSAAVPLMYESWEYRRGDVDLIACRERGIPVAGTNERHPAVDVFSYLGTMAVKLLLDAGVAPYGCRALLLCDNPFSDYIERGLAGAGAVVDRVVHLGQAQAATRYDAIVLAMRPRDEPAAGPDEAALIAANWPGAVLAQFWGDIDRSALLANGIPVWPPESPASGHMGILPSAVGPEPIVRLQTGGLKVGELLWRARSEGHDCERAVDLAVDSGFADRIELAFTTDRTP